ncbi:MAG: DMT family transporter [Anaerolineales bacterium]
MTILFGLLSAIVWGGGDFVGGLASRRVGAWRAVFYAEIIGLALLLVALGFYREELISTRGLLLGASAGAVGSLGLLALYRAMQVGKMSIAAPVSALLAALLPVAVGVLTVGLPPLTQVAGVGLALLSIWLVSQTEGDVRLRLERLSDLRLPLLAGIGFGTYFILIHSVAQEDILWPMIASRTGGTLVLVAVLFLRRESVNIPRAGWPLVTLSGTLDVGGNLFYVLAAQAGRMDIAAVLSSLYPGMTALLAWFVLKEHISSGQRLGILAALAAIVLMTV